MIETLGPGIREGLRQLWCVLPDARLVGGAVRDLLAGQEVADIDLATPEPPDLMVSRVRAAGIKVVETGLAHGTVTAVIGGRPFELTTLREDLDTDGRHARVAWTTDWRADAARRDFTINAMFLSRDDVLHDFFGGADDLRRGRVRFVGTAARRIEEDRLRILRFFRFQARYGRGDPDRDALPAIQAGLDGLDRLSAERVWSELSRLLAGPSPGDTVLLMDRCGVLNRLLPGADAMRVAALDRIGAPSDAVLRLGALAGGDAAWADLAARRLKLSRAESGRLIALLAPVDGATDANALRRRLADAPLDVVYGRSWLAGEPDTVRAMLGSLETPVFALSGRDAAAAGVVPGPEMGRALAQVRDWWLSGGCLAGRAECLDRLRVIAMPAASPETSPETLSGI